MFAFRVLPACLRFLAFHPIGWTCFIALVKAVSTGEIIGESTIGHLPGEQLRQLVSVVPPLPEQQAIAYYLEAKAAEIDALIADKEKQVELLKEYRKSLISEAVTGKLKVPGVK